MIIVYLSIALVVGSLIFMGIYAFKTYKQVKPTVNRIINTTTRMKESTDTIKAKANVLAANQQQLIEDIDVKKEKVNFTVKTAKQTPKTLKQFWNINPFAKDRRLQRERSKRRRTLYSQQ
ncbi:DUF948 domain-containing protein [Metabacillus lacus]|nr:DUF948 domain-containing protein [Metabacillus lacus]